MKFGCLLVALIAIFTASAFAQQSTPKAAVESFYRFDGTHSQTFDRRNIDARKRWFSPELYRLLRNELRGESAYLRANPGDKPYFGDGLPFRPVDEPCQAGSRQLRRGLSIRQTFRSAAQATATSTFSYPRACKEGGDPIVYTVHLIRLSGRWLIDDVNFGENSTLKKTLRRKGY